jgi:hypothetical protein
MNETTGGMMAGKEKAKKGGKRMKSKKERSRTMVAVSQQRTRRRNRA